MTQPEVLVVLPTLGDRLETLKETLESIDVQRSDLDLTIALVTPPSALEARELGKSFGAVIVDDPKIGISAAINAGLAIRSTESYYAWVGDDDLFRPAGLRTLKRILESQERAVLAFGGCEYINPGGRVVAVSNAGWLATFLLPWGPDLIPHPGTMVRLDALETIGGFDRDLKFAMDLDAFLKLRRHGRFAWTRSTVSAFRWHPDSLTVSNRLSSSRESEAVKRRHLPAVLRPLSPLWQRPNRWASSFAARRLNARARSMQESQPSAPPVG